MKGKRVLFVCLGNICRSPLAHGIFEHLLEEKGIREDFVVDSCGTGSWHIGDPPHPGSRKVAKENGISLAGQTSRPLRAIDFEEFDYLVAMDSDNLAVLNSNKDDSKAKIFLLRDYDLEGKGQDVPDPYYTDTFENVFNIINRSCKAFLEDIL